ncbi:MAG: thiamine pyrophosphate-binding protein [Rubrivivax sp.]
MSSPSPGAGVPTARHFIDGLHEAGIDWLFCNLGTDHVTLVDELARAEMEGRAAPRVLLCPHENVAVHMAGGYAALTGRGQGVMVHVDAGTANAAMGLHNLMRGRLPVMLMAGRAPYALHGELPGARATTMCTTCRICSTWARWCGPMSSGSTTCPPVWWPRRSSGAGTR